MKKILFWFVILFTTMIYGQEDFDFSKVIKFDFNLVGTSRITDIYFADSLSGSQDIKTGYGFSLEATYNITDLVALGAGASYQFKRPGDIKILSDSLKMIEEVRLGKKYEQGNFGYLAIFGIIEIAPYRSKVVVPRIIGHLGYNLYYGDDAYKGDYLLKGGIYYGAGISITLYGNYQAEAKYNIHRGMVTHAEDKFFETQYSYTNLSIGYRF